jgi:uncharacterized phiE125 gp8 family phage protein
MTSPLRAPWTSPTTAWSVLLEPPAVEPVTVANVKLRAGLDWPVEDPRETLVAEHIVAARQLVERRTGLALLTQTRRVFVALEAFGVVPLPDQTTPLQSIISVTNATDGTALDSGAYAPDAAGRVVLPAGSWVLECVVGYETPETLAAQAAPLVQAVALLAAHYATLGRDALIIGMSAAEAPLGFEEALAPYELVRMI